MGKLNPFKAPLRAPFTVCLWITDYCQLSCKYCYAASSSKIHMDTKRLLNLVDELVNIHVFEIVIAGGEPFLHPDIFEIIDKLLSKGIYLDILTNGIALDTKFVERLHKIVGSRMPKLVIQVSLDSPDVSINDQTRGEGIRVKRNIIELVQHGFTIQIACVINSLNIKNAHQLIDELYPAVKRFHFLNIQRTSKAKSNSSLLLNESQIYDFWMHLWHYSKNFPPDLCLPSLRTMLRVYGFDNLGQSSDPRWKASLSCTSCTSGLTHIDVDSQFNVLGCDIARDFTFMGNVRSKSFVKVWHSPLAHKIRTSPIPACYWIERQALKT